MALTPDDLRAIKGVVDESVQGIKSDVVSLRDEVNSFKSEMSERFDEQDQKLEAIWQEVVKYTGEIQEENNTVHNDLTQRVQKLETGTVTA